VTKIIPKRNPIFHINEIEEGVGRSKREDLTTLEIEFFFIL